MAGESADDLARRQRVRAERLMRSADHISAHTVHDHVRSVRRKLGVRSRAEVAAMVFTDHYFEGFLGTAAITHSPGEH